MAETTAVTEAPATEAVTATEATEQIAGTTEQAVIDPKEYQRIKDALKATNAESAARRKELEALRKESETRKLAEMSELDRLKAENAAHTVAITEREKELAALKLERDFDKAVSRLALSFYNEDARDEALKACDPAQPIDKEIKRVTTARPYLLKQVAAPDLDSRETGKKTSLSDAETRAIAEKYGVK